MRGQLVEWGQECSTSPTTLKKTADNHKDLMTLPLMSEEQKNRVGWDMASLCEWHIGHGFCDRILTHWFLAHLITSDA